MVGNFKLRARCPQDFVKDNNARCSLSPKIGKPDRFNRSTKQQKRGTPLKTHPSSFGYLGNCSLPLVEDVSCVVFSH